MASETPVGGHLIAGQQRLLIEELVDKFTVDEYYKRIPISYGVELQFMIPVLTAGNPDPHNDDFRKVAVVPPETTYEQKEDIVRDEVLRILREEVGVPAWTHPGPPYPIRATVDIMDAESRAVSGMDQYSQWVVTTDRELIPKPEFAVFYSWVGVKVRSNKRVVSWPNHFDEIAQAIVALRYNLRMRLRHTTFLSVHVGESWFDPMTYEMGPRFFRVFCTLWWFLEQHVMDLVHPSRRTSPHCQPIAEKSRLARMSGMDVSKELSEEGMFPANFKHSYEQILYIAPPSLFLHGIEWERIKTIWYAEDADTICQKMTVPVTKEITMSIPAGGDTTFFRTESRGSVGFQGFTKNATPEDRCSHNDGETGTVEFRCMEGTLDPLLILNWLAVVIRIYDFSRRGNTADIKALIQRARGAVPYDGLQLLEDLGLPEQFEYFQEKIRNHWKEIDIDHGHDMFVGRYGEPTRKGVKWVVL
ncbi:uncharacterized protein F4822DRAFT_91860 [Hypoxylon trugodes]|uniref:uncharacterized protein n=1 Tax=Hypoxylon trugodes TaxID=326681 RepID=UPI002190C290|nr:uncharacterized protein F4822DRAFT_91860 [Hypoxylon trugodes]KAI1383075.1 hypothetical protein F4822DRAFT_91860 [Hypoxylon trugodes]